MNKISTQILDGELWWGGTTNIPASKQCYSADTKVFQEVDRLGGQSAPFYLSSKGRYIWADSPLKITFDEGKIEAEGKNVLIKKAGECLRDAYLDAMKNHFPFEDKALPEKFFTTAQYNTWMEFTYNPTQKSVLEYAHAIVDSGYTPGILIIDEGWHVHYGAWEFDFAKFPNPKAMVDELHELGFTVMLWVVPYVTSDNRAFIDHYEPYASELVGKKYERRLLRQPNGEIAIVKWWGGFSAMYDMTSETDIRHLEGRLNYLKEKYGVDGFKLDGGNIIGLQKESWITAPPDKTPEEINKAWNAFGARFEYHEYKDTYDRGGKATIERIRDRFPVWDEMGIASLIPIALMQGLLGYAYICPDMIGGGEWSYTIDKDFVLDEELFVRMAQCSALFPMMQFSWAPWRVLGKEAQAHCLAAAKLHAKFGDYICEQVRATAKSGEPIMRSMEYSFPARGYERVFDQFMLGDKYLVAPVIEKGAVSRKVSLPEGKWKYCDGTVYDGGCDVTVASPISVLPYFERV